MNYLGKDNKSTNFYCFSPPVMIATFAIEIFLALYILFRYHLTATVKLIVLALASLALFQLAEYNVCGGASSVWARVGYVAITALPVLGIHLMTHFTGRKLNYVGKTAYASMGFLMAYFLISPSAFTGYQCTGNYVIFQLTSTMTSVYMLYYYGWLLAAIAMGIKYIFKPLTTKRQKSLIKALILGYAVFIIPTALVITLNPTAASGIPSIMCGFAVFFAVILGVKIAPLSSEVKRDIKLPFISKD